VTWFKVSRPVIIILVVTRRKLSFQSWEAQKEVCPNKYDTGVHPEIIWPPKPQMLIFLELWQMGSRF